MLPSRLKKLLSVFSLQSRISEEIKDIALESRENLKQDTASGLRVNDTSVVEVTSLKAAAWGTQTAIAVVPAMYIASKEGRLKVKRGLTIAITRVRPTVIRCYRCHKMGHMANSCSFSPGKERCRKYDEMGHAITKCGNDAKCTLCSRGSEVRTNQVMGSLACPTLS